MAPEIQRDKWPEKNKSARPRFSNSPIEPPFTSGHRWDPLRKIDATHQEESKKAKVKSNGTQRSSSGKTGWKIKMSSGRMIGRRFLTTGNSCEYGGGERQVLAEVENSEWRAFPLVG
jgi:hypothetical protein